jgi:hypothetical protein
MSYWDSTEHSEATLSRYADIYQHYLQRVEELKAIDPLLLQFLSISYFAEYLIEKFPLGSKQHISQVIRFMNAGRNRKKHR